MMISCNTIVDRRDHVQYLTDSKSYSDNCTCSLTEQITTLDWNHLCNIARKHHEEQPCKIIVNLDQPFRSKCR